MISLPNAVAASSRTSSSRSSSTAPVRLLPGAARLLLFLVLVFPAAGCGIFDTGGEIADEARVVVSGETPVALELITSTRFTRTVEEGATVLILDEADTTYLDLASTFDEIYPVKPDRGFFVRLTNPDTLPATVSMQVYFDGDLEYNQQDVSLEGFSLEFSYLFRSY